LILFLISYFPPLPLFEEIYLQYMDNELMFHNVALETQTPPSSILLSAPYKSPAFLERVLADQIGLIFICHEEEIAEIARFVKNDQVQPIGIRLQSPLPNKQIGVLADGKIISEIVDQLAKNTNLALTTLQLHIGTQLDNQTFKRYLLFWSGQLVSLFGSSVSSFVIIWWITLETGSALYLSLSSLIGFAPMIVLAPVTGVLADRWNRKILIAVDGSQHALHAVEYVARHWADKRIGNPLEVFTKNIAKAKKIYERRNSEFNIEDEPTPNDQTLQEPTVTGEWDGVTRSPPSPQSTHHGTRRTDARYSSWDDLFPAARFSHGPP
jgi:hypothetical protein